MEENKEAVERLVCDYCSKPISRYFNFCPWCGTALRENWGGKNKKEDMKK